MQNEESVLSIPLEWQERFIIKRIKEENIEITLKQRNLILESLGRGDNFVQIGKYTLMINSIKSIDPVWEPDNIPPRPREVRDFETIEGKEQLVITNKEILMLWDKLFKDKTLNNNSLLDSDGYKHI